MASPFASALENAVWGLALRLCLRASGRMQAVVLCVCVFVWHGRVVEMSGVTSNDQHIRLISMGAGENVRPRT